ncbi:hypothetical protein [Alloactinosynnema sp. L-07]|nr:hypothetical protein [Alloactinosynnema sp. L-07]
MERKRARAHGLTDQTIVRHEAPFMRTNSRTSWRWPRWSTSPSLSHDYSVALIDRFAAAL